MEKEPSQIRDIYETYRLVEEINSEYTNEKNQLTEKFNSNELELNDLLLKKKEKENKIIEFFERKEYFSGQFHATSHSILEVSNEIKKSKLKIQQELNNVNFENAKRKVNDDYVILLENMKKKIVEINENLNQEIQTHTPNTTSEVLDEKQKRLQQIRQSIITDSFQIEIASKPFNKKKIIEEIEDFLKDYFSKYLSLEALEKLISLSYENLWKQNQKYKYLDLNNFLQILFEMIEKKKGEIKNNVPSGKRNNYEGSSFYELQNKYGNYFMEIKSFQLDQREFINLLRDGTPEAKELIPLVEKIDIAIEKLAANEENVRRVGIEIANNLQLNNNFGDRLVTFKESFDKIKKSKQNLKKSWEFFSKELVKSNNVKLIKEKTDFMLDFSLIFSLADFSWWLDAVKIELNTIPLIKPNPDLPFLDQDDLEIIEKLFLKLKLLKEYDDVKQKEFQIDEVKQKLEDNSKLFKSLELEIKAEEELPIKTIKHYFFDMWRDGMMTRIDERHSKLIQTKTTDPTDTNTAHKAKEKLKKLKKSLKERMLKDQLEVIRCAKKDKELASEVEKLNKNINFIEENNKEIKGRLINLKKEFDEKIAEINLSMMRENETKR